MSLAQKIQSRIGKGTKSEYDEDVLIDVHHTLMREYGWIPLKEFLELPLPTLWNLIECIRKEKEREAKAMKKK